MIDTMLLINRISIRLKRRIDNEVATLGITAIQGHVINYIYQSNCDVFQKDLEEYLDIRGSSVTVMIQVMEKNDLLKREAVLKDQRLKKLVLTPKAIEIHSKIQAIITKVESKALEGISPEKCERINEMLRKIISNTENL